jgi:prepilin-type N-terminal cleavage/methylation domain-containing protein
MKLKIQFKKLLETFKVYFKIETQAGFTLLELIISMSIMATLFAVIATGIVSQRSNRDLNIASNELITNLRKLQANSLSSRGLAFDQPVQYYILKFDKNIPGQYTIQAIYNSSVQPKLIDIETIKLPINVKFASNNPFYSYRVGFNANPNCVLLSFGAPYAKILVTSVAGSCTPVSATNPYTIVNTDDYFNIPNFIVNGPTLTSADTNLDIVLSSVDNSISKTVTIKGISGLIYAQ